MAVVEGPIVKWEAEERERLYSPGLDLDYISSTAKQIALAMDEDQVSEASYQPGDGTRYALVFVPLMAIKYRAPARVKDGRAWGDKAVDGLLYDHGCALVCWVDGPCYPLRLVDRSVDLAASYVAEHWKTTQVSGATLALLFRAVAWHLEELNRG